MPHKTWLMKLVLILNAININCFQVSFLAWNTFFHCSNWHLKSAIFDLHCLSVFVFFSFRQNWIFAKTKQIVSIEAAFSTELHNHLYEHRIKSYDTRANWTLSLPSEALTGVGGVSSAEEHFLKLPPTPCPLPHLPSDPRPPPPPPSFSLIGPATLQSNAWS